MWGASMWGLQACLPALENLMASTRLPEGKLPERRPHPAAVGRLMPVQPERPHWPPQLVRSPDGQLYESVKKKEKHEL